LKRLNKGLHALQDELAARFSSNAAVLNHHRCGALHQSRRANS